MAQDPACVFCKIAKREIPSSIVYEDTAIVGILDINPLAPGHTLVVPKAHVERLELLDKEVNARLFDAVRRLTWAVQLGMGVPSTTVAINNGPEAGQEVPHLHVHIVPRKAGDGGGPIHAVMAGERPKVTKDDFAKHREAIIGMLR